MINSLVTTKNTEYGNGIITHVFEDGSLCLIKFDNKPLPIMCSLSSKKTVHNDSDDNVAFKIVCSTTEVPE